MIFLAVSNVLPAGETAVKKDYVNSLAEKLEPTRKITYKTVGDRTLQLHIFEPKDFQATDQRACFVTIHGGGWGNGEPRRMYPFAAHFAGLGMVGISIEYRLVKGGGVTVFDCVKDARSAMRYIRKHAGELGVDPGRIIVQGGSAGGHLAAGTALFDSVDDPSDDLTVSPAPMAMVLLFPVIDTSKEGYGNARIGERWKDISPLHRVHAGVPPTIIFHGTGDKTTPYKGAQAFQEAMKQNGNRCELVTNEGGGHGYLMGKQEAYDETMKRSIEFLRSLGVLKP